MTSLRHNETSTSMSVSSSPPAPSFREESEEHAVRRLEAFSDIVIAFSLAQMTLNLVLPNDVLSLFTTHSLSLLAFGITFIVVSGMWWSHHELFTHYFVPTPANVVLNFVSLAGVMFLVYTLQVWLHSERHHNIAYAMYTFSIAIVVALRAYLMRNGVLVRGHRMRPELAALGMRRAFRMAVLALGCAAVGVVSLLGKGGAVVNYLLIAAALVVAALRLYEGRAHVKKAA